MSTAAVTNPLQHHASNILYIMGTARSGTTILGVLLGSAQSMLFAGEVGHFYDDGFKEGAICSCGEQVPSCPVWRTPYDHVTNDDSAARRAATVDELDRHSSFLRTALGLIPATRWSLYANDNTDLFSLLASASESNWIVDSTKYAGRALALRRIGALKVKVICLTRSPEGLVHSFQKPNKTEQLPKSRPSLVAYYAYVLLCLACARWRLGDDCLQVRYEELMASPSDVLDRIASWSGADLTRVRSKVERGEALCAAHIVTGNRLRYAREVRFETKDVASPSTGWRDVLTIRLMNAWRRVLGF